jgi:hypothetical protein
MIGENEAKCRPRKLSGAAASIATVASTLFLSPQVILITVAITSPFWQRPVLDYEGKFSPRRARDSSVAGGSNAYHRSCGGDSRVIRIGRMLPLSSKSGLHGTAAASATEVGGAVGWPCHVEAAGPSKGVRQSVGRQPMLQPSRPVGRRSGCSEVGERCHGRERAATFGASHSS